MADSLANLPEGNSPTDPVMNEIFGEPMKKKKDWKNLLKILAIGLGTFLLTANPLTGAMLAKVSPIQGAYKNFFLMAGLFAFVFFVALWYF